MCEREAELSRRGYCRECWIKVMMAVKEQMVKKEGPYYERWKKGMLASVGVKTD